MAIHPPGQKFRSSRILSKRGGKRSVVVTLSLTAMVDMFTVLVIFLLQNYNATGEVLFLPKEVELPKAEKIKELKPAVAVTISQKQVFVDKDPVILTVDVAAHPDWLIPQVKAQVEKYLELARQKEESRIDKRLQKVMGSDAKTASFIPDWKKVTVQADRGIDFGVVKKILYTVTEAGAGEINFAVLKEKK
ncbi:MAG: biopolymer transporter ExbD [Bdellovibrionaceae bacterium]|jgi:biopolymer transport protein ExbD|nr:biopolymer transporter ExbD [Pseudobdellovibrionaceae bacterium]